MKLFNHPWLFFLIACGITLAVKIPHLSLPFFNDETFSYYPAILEMAKTGPSMLPGSIPLIFSKGHPLFFYFLASMWVKYIASDSIILTRIFPLILSLFALFVFHRFARKHCNILLANIAVLLLALQPMFLAQASLLLPEILLFALFMLSFDSFLSKRYLEYAIWASLMMLTKETGAVFVLVFGITYLIQNYSNWQNRQFRTELVLLATPALTYGLFLLFHYFEFGVFFFSEHLDLISIESDKILYKLKSGSSVLFTRNGHNLILFPALIALLYLLIRKKTVFHAKFLGVSLAIILTFLLFTILNFYTYRYIFPVIGILLLASLVLIQQVKTKYPLVNAAYVVLILSVTAFYSATKRGQSDADLGYVQFLKVHKQMVEYCEQQGWYDMEFAAGYNMVMGMRDNFSGYLDTDRNFRMHHLPGITGRNMIIYDSTCWPFELENKENTSLQLIKRFEYKKHWGEIYQTMNKE